MNRVSQSICLVLYLTEFVILTQCTDLTIQHLTSKLNTDRNKRDTDDDFAENVAKRSQELASKHSEGSSINDENALEKRLMPYDELEKRLRHFIGKRTDDEEQFEKRGRSRGRYFLGKRQDSDNEEDKRARYFLGKRDSDEIDEEKRYRYFVGKRDSDDSMAKRRYNFIGKRQDLDDDFEKRRRFFLGKRRRFFLGKRGSLYDDGFEEGSAYADVAPSGLRDFIQKRMRYFLGKRSDESSDNESMETDKRFARHFLGR